MLPLAREVSTSHPHTTMMVEPYAWDAKALPAEEDLGTIETMTGVGRLSRMMGCGEDPGVGVKGNSVPTSGASRDEVVWTSLHGETND